MINYSFSVVRRNISKEKSNLVGSVFEWLERRDCDRYDLDSKLTRAFLLWPLKKYFIALSPSWRFWQAVLNFSHIFIKFEPDSNILASPKAGLGNSLPYVLAPPSLCFQ